MTRLNISNSLAASPCAMSTVKISWRTRQEKRQFVWQSKPSVDENDSRQLPALGALGLGDGEMLFNVLPVSSVLDMTDGDPADSQHLGKLPLRNNALHLSHETNVLLRHFGTEVPLAIVLVSSAFALSVLDVVLIGSGKDMVRIGASRIVAGMAGLIRRVFAVREEIRIPMG